MPMAGTTTGTCRAARGRGASGSTRLAWARPSPTPTPRSGSEHMNEPRDSWSESRGGWNVRSPHGLASVPVEGGPEGGSAPSRLEGTPGVPAGDPQVGLGEAPGGCRVAGVRQLLGGAGPVGTDGRDVGDGVGERIHQGFVTVNARAETC